MPRFHAGADPLSKVAALCAARLAENPDIQQLLLARGFTEHTIRDHQVGYAPGGGTMVRACLEAGLTRDQAWAHGLGAPGGRPFDKLQRRITFPVRNMCGETIGFNARATRAGQEPKFLDCFHLDYCTDGRPLYSVDVASRNVADRTIVIVEGATDVLALHQAGIKNVIGLLGTVITDSHLAAVSRLASSVILCFDQDRAGSHGARRAAACALIHGLDVRIAHLPPGTDPAETANSAQGPAQLQAAINAAVSFDPDSPFEI